MRSLLSFALFAVISLGASAEPASERSIEDLLATTKTEALMDSIYGNVEQMMRQGIQQSVQGKALSAEQRQALDTVPAKFVAVMREEFNWTKMKPLYVQIYRETFEQVEIDGLNAFYKSAAGQAFINKMPIVMQKSVALTQGQMQSFAPKMKAAMDKALEEAKIPRRQ